MKIIDITSIFSNWWNQSIFDVFWEYYDRSSGSNEFYQDMSPWGKERMSRMEKHSKEERHTTYM